MHECPEGLHFNTAIEQCDWPPASGCLAGRRPETQPNIPKDEGEDEIEDEDEANTPGCIGTCPISDSVDKTILLPYAGDCTKYCTCSNGRPLIMLCPDNLHFDAKNSVCNWKWAAKCQS
ncbi:Peritrophin-1 [Temnothorax longispinosus]|uniref:Peritrophin-1 n=2 Tax=Temnothorax longispinosus TaxID=300112 RepID=A0A4S2KB19_9HYME|nr:Peritrophin-1 [Temnothorax longispinosus]